MTFINNPLACCLSWVLGGSCHQCDVEEDELWTQSTGLPSPKMGAWIRAKALHYYNYSSHIQLFFFKTWCSVYTFLFLHALKIEQALESEVQNIVLPLIAYLLGLRGPKAWGLLLRTQNWEQNWIFLWSEEGNHNTFPEISVLPSEISLDNLAETFMQRCSLIKMFPPHPTGVLTP